MEKRLNKPHERNVRLDNPTGLIGVPPDLPCCCLCPGCCPLIRKKCHKRRKEFTQ